MALFPLAGYDLLALLAWVPLAATGAIVDGGGGGEVVILLSVGTV